MTPTNQSELEKAREKQLISYLKKALEIVERIKTPDVLIRSELEYLKGYLQGGVEIIEN